MTITELSEWTLEKYLELPEGPPHFEYEDGELIPMTTPMPDHQDLADEMIHAIKSYLKTHRLGRAYREVGLLLPQGQAYVPDIAFLATANLDLLAADGKIRGVPDLVVELTSQNIARDTIHKYKVYEENGVPWYWVANSRTLEFDVYRLNGGTFVLASHTDRVSDFRPTVFPELVLNLEQLLDMVGESP